MENFAIVVVKSDDLYIVVAEGEYKDLKSIKQAAEKVYDEVKLISMDKEEYDGMQDDINLRNETILDLWGVETDKNEEKYKEI